MKTINTEEELANIRNTFIRIPPPDFLWWRSDADYVYESVKGIERYYDFSFPDHAIVLIDGEYMCKNVRIVYTNGDVDMFKHFFNDKTQLDLDGISSMNLNDMIADSQELYEW